MIRNTISPLKRARFLSGLRSYEVAQLLGITATRYSLAENGRAPIRTDEAKKLAKLLRVPVKELFPDGEK